MGFARTLAHSDHLLGTYAKVVVAHQLPRQLWLTLPGQVISKDHLTLLIEHLLQLQQVFVLLPEHI